MDYNLAKWPAKRVCDLTCQCNCLCQTNTFATKIISASQYSGQVK